MDSGKITDKWCWCGLPLYLINGKEVCKRHGDKKKPERDKIKKYSGKSKSEFAFNDYK